jgi:hypothetical protein
MASANQENKDRKHRRIAWRSIKKRDIHGYSGAQAVSDGGNSSPFFFRQGFSPGLFPGGFGRRLAAPRRLWRRL